MTAYRRLRVSGGTYFFTVNLAQRGSSTLVDHVDLLRTAYASTLADRPFRTDAIVILPDHLHCIWTLPEGDDDFSTRWAAIKGRFSRALRQDVGGMSPTPSQSKARRGEVGVWQRRFWEHYIRSDADLAHHLHYCWANPVKHGLVERATAWDLSSIHRDIRLGRVGTEWSGQVFTGVYGE